MYRIVVSLIILFAASTTHAHIADTKILSIDGNTVISGEPLPILVPYLPFTVSIEGTVSHDDSGNLNQLALWGTDNGIYFYPPTRYFQGSGNQSIAPFSIPWTIESEGTHVISVEATHDTPQNLTQCKAAPAIASSYLREKGEKPRSSNTNQIAAVAQETGVNGILSAQNKCLSEYRAQVIFFVSESGN